MGAPKTEPKYPCFNSIGIVIAWCTMYSGEILNKTHPLWDQYFAYSEWFRHRLCSHFELSLDTEWEEIYRLVGCLKAELYATKEEAEKAFNLGRELKLCDDVAPAMFEQMEYIRFRITGCL